MPPCSCYYASPLIDGALSDAVWRLTSVWRLSFWRLSVCLSVVYIGPKSRTKRPRKTKIDVEVAHVTRDSNTTFKIKGQLAGAGEYCGGLEHSLLVLQSIEHKCFVTGNVIPTNDRVNTYLRSTSQWRKQGINPQSRGTNVASPRPKSNTWFSKSRPRTASHYD